MIQSPSISLFFFFSRVFFMFFFIFPLKEKINFDLTIGDWDEAIRDTKLGSYYCRANSDKGKSEKERKRVGQLLALQREREAQERSKCVGN